MFSPVEDLRKKNGKLIISRRKKEKKVKILDKFMMNKKGIVKEKNPETPITKSLRTLGVMLMTSNDHDCHEVYNISHDEISPKNF